MPVRVPTAAVLLLAVASSGCWGIGGGDADTDAATETGATQPRSNQLPSARLLASVGNGTAPLAVAFLLEGSDPDGDALSWTLDLGDGNATQGTSLPSNVTHAFAAPGNFTVALDVMDGNATSRSHLVIRVGPAPPSATALFVEAQDFPSSPAASATVPLVGYAGGAACAGFWDGTSGIDCVFFALEPGWTGLAFNATADDGDPDLEFWPTCDPDEVFAIAGYRHDGPEVGTIPADALCVVIWNGETSMATPTHTFVVL